MVRVFSASKIYQSFNEHMRRAMHRMPAPPRPVNKAQLQSLESCSVVISEEARRRLAAEQHRPEHWDWEF
jgi:hypothetical protein